MSQLFPDGRALAIFLDIDGTLLELAPTPEAVAIPPGLLDLLRSLSERFGGALALISGRELSDIDRLFAPHRFCGAGMHGCELRPPAAAAIAAMVDTRLVERIHDGCRAMISIASGVLVECKSFGAAIHYRLAAHAEQIVLAHAMQLLQQIGPAFELQRGKCVCELKPAGFSKGTAIGALMSRAPFIGRHPIFIGDDATDEHGFAAVNRLGGISIKVGLDGQSHALQRVASPADVHHLLAHLKDRSTPTLTGAPDWLESHFKYRIAQS